MLLQYFYVSLDTVNKGVDDQLIQGGIIKQKFTTSCNLWGNMKKIFKAWSTRDNLVSPTHRGPSKEQLSKDQERDENMAMQLTQMNLLTKHVMRKPKEC